MLQLSAMILNRPVLSLRTSSQVATTVSAIINPNNLKIEGFYCHDHAKRKDLVLLSQDIREILPQGIVINDQDALTEPDELVRLDKVLQANFVLLGKHVVTVSGDKVGKVTDFSVETNSMFIQKLYVTQSLFKAFNDANLGVDRTQIVEITSKKIVIHDLLQKVPAGARALA
ncbi:MAG TPA: hypothetical protein VLF91_02600 [Candidatus Saccharimonadales bacterium]|nr:hypothetical protein [Candidatus Saccharimonadales bacterium]